MSGSINNCLRLIKQRLTNWMGEVDLIPVIGNEAADLDSIASCIGYSVLSNQSGLQKSHITLPLINIERQDLKLRPEVEFVLNQCQVDFENLFFIDDPIVKRILEDSNTQPKGVVLVDHNRIHGNFERWSKKVDVIFDHHYDDRCHLDANPRWIETCGSASSLVILWWQSVCTKDPSLMDWFRGQNDLSTLLLSPVIIDTVLMNPEFKRVTATDIQAYEFLKNSFPSEIDSQYSQQLFDQIQQAKSNIGHLKNDQLFRKDYKQWKVSQMDVGISAITQWDITEWIERDSIDQISKDIDEYVFKHHLDIFCILLTYENKTKKTFERKFIYVSTEQRSQDILESLLGENPFKLKEFHHFDTGKGLKVRLFNQEEVSWSRKLIFPALKKVIENFK